MHDTCSTGGVSYQCRLPWPLLLHSAYVYAWSVQQSSEHTWVLQNAIYYAYFAPYSYERHQDLIARVIGHKRVKLQILGETLDGHDIDFLQIGIAQYDFCKDFFMCNTPLTNIMSSNQHTSKAMFRCSTACCRAGLYRQHIRP